MTAPESPLAAMHVTRGPAIVGAMTFHGIAALTGPAMRAICAERLEQVERHGFTPAHDAEHREAEIAQGALSYLMAGLADALPADALAHDLRDRAFSAWPFHIRDWKPGTAIECYVKTAAMLMAEIDRLAALEASEDLFAAAPAAAPTPSTTGENA